MEEYIDRWIRFHRRQFAITITITIKQNLTSSQHSSTHQPQTPHQQHNHVQRRIKGSSRARRTSVCPIINTPSASKNPSAAIKLTHPSVQPKTPNSPTASTKTPKPTSLEYVSNQPSNQFFPPLLPPPSPPPPIYPNPLTLLTSTGRSDHRLARRWKDSRL